MCLKLLPIVWCPNNFSLLIEQEGPGHKTTTVSRVYTFHKYIRLCCNTLARESGDYHSSLWHTGSGNLCYKKTNTWVGTRQETYRSRDHRPSTDRFFLFSSQL